MNPTALAEALATAHEGDQHHYIIAAFDAARDRGWIDMRTYSAGLRRADSGAYVDAVLLLLPEGVGFVLMDCAAKVGREVSRGATPGMALASAVLLFLAARYAHRSAA